MQQHIERSTNRAWLGEFLRSRRERLSPKDYGFPVVSRRRSRGLRRDEVAQLSGISIAYYTWIEQGRNINMSADVLNSIARALGFSKAERAHLFALVGIENGENAGGDDRMHPTIAHFLDFGSSSWCALLYDACFNVLQSTQLATEIFGIPPDRGIESNMLYRLFADPAQREVWVDWESEARMGAGMFRHALVRQAATSAGFRLLEILLGIADFARIWGAYDVCVSPSPDEFFREEPWKLVHPDVGLMRIHRVAMAIPARVDRTLVMCSAADAETPYKFRTLLERARSTERYLKPA
jgi:transcriptional regulator with XRE-family HTH domain